MKISLKEKAWWSYLEEDLQELLDQSLLLIKIVEKWGGDVPGDRQEFHDYAFVVFPAAKAYEGFLKKMFLDLELITKQDYLGKRFRVGKALNPALDKRYRTKEGVYHRLVEYCGSEALANYLWKTWKNCRNILFHWFPNERNTINFIEAKQRLLMVIEAIDKSFEVCQLNSK
jgi:hypothetical protein